MKDYTVAYSNVSVMGYMRKIEETDLSETRARNLYRKLLDQLNTKALNFEIRMEVYERATGMKRIVMIDYYINQNQ